MTQIYTCRISEVTASVFHSPKHRTHHCDLPSVSQERFIEYLDKTFAEITLMSYETLQTVHVSSFPLLLERVRKRVEKIAGN